MPELLKPAEIFHQAAAEGERRLNQSTVELMATGFIAGFTIVFGLIAMGIVEAYARPLMGETARILGALAFGSVLPFLIIGRAELFSENFFDPVAAALKVRIEGVAGKMLRLWVFTLVLNLVGGGLLVLILSVDDALPAGAHVELARIGNEIAERSAQATLMRSIIGGALVALLSYLVIASQDVTGRILLAYTTGFLLALGPFEHVVVTVLHLAFAITSDASITLAEVGSVCGLAIAGNLLGGVGLVTLSHFAQAREEG